MKIAVIGRTSWLYNTITRLVQSGHEVVLIITCKASPEYSKKENDFKKVAQQYNIPFIQTIHIEDFVHIIQNSQADIAVSVNWPTILGEKIIDIFPKGILNAHPGDLPRYRGNACPNWAIINHEKQIGLSVHYMKAGELDSGDILIKKYIPIKKDTYITDIYKQLDCIIPDAFVEAIDGIQKGFLNPISQDESKDEPLRVYPRIPKDSMINWNKPAEELELLVRASASPFSGAYTYWNSKKVIIWKAKAITSTQQYLASPGQVLWKEKTGTVAVATGEGVLLLEEIQYQGKRDKAANILTSLRTRLGMDIESEIEKIWERLS